MLSYAIGKLKSTKEQKEEGFTLIELLVVILIIGILSAIAIPAFMNQRKSAVEASVKSDLKNAGTIYEGSYKSDVGYTEQEVSVSKGNSVTLANHQVQGGGFCLYAFNQTQPENIWYYNSKNGGLTQDSTGCSGGSGVFCSPLLSEVYSILVKVEDMQYNPSVSTVLRKFQNDVSLNSEETALLNEYLDSVNSMSQDVFERLRNDATALEEYSEKTLILQGHPAYEKRLGLRNKIAELEVNPTTHEYVNKAEAESLYAEYLLTGKAAYSPACANI